MNTINFNIKVEENKLGLNLVTLTRDEIEADLPDYVRFRKPQDYLTEDSLKFFKSDDNRKKFVEKFWK
jgi:hypothetical protein